MKRYTLPLLLCAIVIVAMGLAAVTLGQVGWLRRSAAPAAPGNITTVSVDPFTRMEIDGALEVVLVQGPAPSVRVESQSDAEVSVRNHGDTLMLRSNRGSTGWAEWFSKNQRAAPKVTVTFTTLTNIDVAGSLKLSAARIATPRLAFDVSGAASVTITDLDTGELRMDGSGAMKADITGRATTQRIRISGAGNYHAPRLVSEAAEVDVSGAGKVLVNAVKTLRIELSGAGVVDYLGSPTVDKSVSGIGRVRQVQSAADSPPISVLGWPSSKPVAMLLLRPAWSPA